MQGLAMLVLICCVIAFASFVIEFISFLTIHRYLTVLLKIVKFNMLSNILFGGIIYPFINKVRVFL